MKAYGLSFQSTPVELKGSEEEILFSVKELLSEIKQCAPGLSSFKLICNASADVRTKEQHEKLIMFKELLACAKSGNYKVRFGLLLTTEQWLALNLAVPTQDEKAKEFLNLLRVSQLICRPPSDLLENPHKYPDVLAKAQLLLEDHLA